MKNNAVDQRRWKTVNVSLYKKNNGGSVRKVAFGMLIRKLIFFVLEFRLAIARQWSREKFAILSLEPQSRVTNVNISNVGCS